MRPIWAYAQCLSINSMTQFIYCNLRIPEMTIWWCLCQQVGNQTCSGAYFHNQTSDSLMLFPTRWPWSEGLVENIAIDCIFIYIHVFTPWKTLNSFSPSSPKLNIGFGGGTSCSQSAKTCSHRAAESFGTNSSRSERKKAGTFIYYMGKCKFSQNSTKRDTTYEEQLLFVPLNSVMHQYTVETKSGFVH